MKKNLKRMLLAQMTMCALLFCIHPEVHADGDAAKIGDVGYPSFAEACNAAEDGQTVTVIQDCSWNETITISKNITIQCDNDCCITASANSAVIEISGNTKAEFINCNFAASGGQGGIVINSGAKLNLNNCDINLLNVTDPFIQNTGELTVDGGIINNDSINAAVWNFGTLEIKGDTVINNKKTGCGVENKQLHETGQDLVGVFTMNGGTINNSGTGVAIVNESELHINGGVINNNGAGTAIGMIQNYQEHPPVLDMPRAGVTINNKAGLNAIVQTADGEDYEALDDQYADYINTVENPDSQPEDVHADSGNTQEKGANAKDETVNKEVYWTPETHYGVFQAAAVQKIAAAGKDTVKLDTGVWISFKRNVYEEMQKKGLPVELTFCYKGVKYRVIIPAGADVLSLVDENGYCGFLNLMAHFGGTVVK